MASRYAKTIKVPEGFPDTLRDFAREVLRQQEKLKTREDILQFGIKYFKDLAEKRAGINNGPSFASEKYMTMADEEIEEYMWQLFRNADPSNSDHLDLMDFRREFVKMVDYLKLNPLERLRCAAEVDELEGATISYPEFIASAMRAISQLKKRKNIESPSYDANAGKEIVVEDSDFFLHGMLREEFASLLREILHHVDVDGVGAVSRGDFLGCLQDGDIGLTRREINLIMYKIESDEVVYSDVISSLFESLVHAHANDLIDTPRTEEVVETMLNKVFQSGDEESTGFLSFGALKTLLRMAGLGLTRIQTTALLSEAIEDEEDSVNYESFAKRIAPMILRMIDYDTQVQMAASVRQYRASEDYFAVYGMNQHEFENALTIAFEAIDENARGCLTRNELVEAIHNGLPHISPKHLACLLALADVNQSGGEFEYSAIIHNGFQALQWLQEYTTLSAQLV